jgi:hypothetical protein
VLACREQVRRVTGGRRADVQAWKKLLHVEHVVLEDGDIETAAGGPGIVVVRLRPDHRRRLRCPRCGQQCRFYDAGEGAPVAFPGPGGDAVLPGGGRAAGAVPAARGADCCGAVGQAGGQVHDRAGGARGVAVRADAVEQGRGPAAGDVAGAAGARGAGGRRPAGRGGPAGRGAQDRDP